MSTRSAAFFDLDRTLMSGSSAMFFVRATYRQGMVSRRQLAGWAVDHLRFRLHGSTDDSTRQALKEAEELLRGVPARQMERLTPELLAAILPRIYPQMIDEIREHQDNGRATFIVSAAGNEIVSLLATVLGMEGGIGTRYEVDADEMMTGRLSGPLVYGAGKVTAMESYAAEHGLDLAESWAYSDSSSDLPMLNAVGHAVVVNPDRELTKVASEHGWQVMRFDKLQKQLAIGLGLVVAATVGGIGSRLLPRSPSSSSRIRRFSR